MAKTARLTIQRWGNSLAVRIPSQVAKSAHFEAGLEVEVSLQDYGVAVVPVGEAKLTLVQKLALFDPVAHGGEAMAGSPVGAEVM